MLIDEILAHQDEAKFILEPFHSRLRAAPKFTLSPTFSAAAGQIACDHQGLEKVISFARLPYPECWFELSNHDRSMWHSRGIAADEAPVKRVGFLATQQPTGLHLHLFWDYTKDGRTGLNTSALCVHLATGAERFQHHPNLHQLPHHSPIWNRLCLWPSDFDPEGVASILRQPKGKLIADMANRDWGGEPSFVVAMLALLHTRNASETQFEPRTTLNKARQRRGKPALMEFHTLKLKLSTKAGARVDADGTHTALRAHFVRGHFKQRASGLFWWSPFMRGDASLGTITKDYEVHI